MSQLKLTLVLLLLTHTISSPYYALCDTEGTIVGGVIRKNTVWTNENSPYILEDDITIRPGVTLRIQEGVTVDFSLWSMIVNGKILATGNNQERIQFHFTTMPLTGYEDARIVFTNKSEPYENSVTGNRLEYLDIFCGENAVRYGLIEGGTIKIDHITIHDSQPYSKHFTVITNGSITNSKFIRTARAIKMEQGDIEGNKFINNTSTLIVITDGQVRTNLLDGGRVGIVVKEAVIFNNTLNNLDYQGINIENNPTSLATLNTSEKPKPEISNNLIMNCGENAIYISGNIRPTIINNVFLDNINGIYFNEHEIYNNENPRILDNIFYNHEYNVYIDREDPRIEIKLQNNWWGTNDTELIEDKIYYENDDPRLRAALYQPILTDLPSFLPKIPYEVTMTQQNHEVKIDNMIPISGTVYPPLEIYDLTFKYTHPDGQSIERTVRTDEQGVFLDEFTPNKAGSWTFTVVPSNIKIIENPSLSAQIYAIHEGSIEETSPETIEEEGSTHVADNAAPIENKAQDPSTGGETHNDSSQTGDTSNTATTQPETAVTDQDPLIIGFIPSIVSIVMLAAVYLGINGIKLRSGIA